MIELGKPRRCLPQRGLHSVQGIAACGEVIDSASMGAHGVSFGAPQVDLDKLRSWKTSVVRRLTTVDWARQAAQGTGGA
jgi:hypothetical protein